MKRLFLALVLLALAMTAAPAAATPPIGGCPPAFELKAISDFGPGFFEFLTGRVDKNGDGYVCAQDLPEALPFPNINFVDNVVRIHS